MPFDGAGNFTRVYNWVADKLASVKIQAARMDGEDDGFADAFNEVLLRNGVAPLTGDLKLGSNNITGVATGLDSMPSITFVGDATTGLFQPVPSSVGIAIDGVEIIRFTPEGMIAAGLGLTGLASIRSVLEYTTYINAAPGATVQIDYDTQAIIIYDVAATANWAFNVRGDVSTSLDDVMAVGNTMTAVVEVPQGATAFYGTAITIDGLAPSQIKWFGGGAPAAGTVNAIDVYSITIFKKADATFYVRASQSPAK